MLARHSVIAAGMKSGIVACFLTACVTPGERTDPPDPLIRVVGALKDVEGNPVPDRRVLFVHAGLWQRKLLHGQERWLRESWTDAQGRFSGSVPPGPYWIGPAPSEKDPTSVPMADIVFVESTPKSVELRLESGEFIEGVVLDPNGNPVASATVSAGSMVFVSSLWTEVDASGRFRLGPLPSGDYLLMANGGGLAESEELRTSAGRHDVVLRLRRPGTVRGRFARPDGGNPGDSEVSFAIAGGLESRWFGYTAADGSFEYSGLTPGTYDCVAHADDGAICVAPRIEVHEEETTEVLLRAEAGGTLWVSYEGTEEQVEVLIVRGEVLVARDDWIERHTTSRLIVPSGDLVLRAKLHGAGTVEERRIRLLPGQTMFLRLDL